MIMSKLSNEGAWKDAFQETRVSWPDDRGHVDHLNQPGSPT